MVIKLVYGNITKAETDAIVNAANSSLNGGGGVCGAIFDAAGWDELQKECYEVGPCPTGQARITKGYNLKAKYIIHAVGPIYKDDGTSRPLLAKAYYNSLRLADEYKLESISFPSISTGIYDYPLEKAAPIAVMAIKRFFKDHPDTTVKEVHLYSINKYTYNAFADVLGMPNKEEK